jgi:hypothetical protein
LTNFELLGGGGVLHPPHPPYSDVPVQRCTCYITLLFILLSIGVFSDRLHQVLRLLMLLT